MAYGIRIYQKSEWKYVTLDGKKIVYTDNIENASQTSNILKLATWHYYAVKDRDSGVNQGVETIEIGLAATKVDLKEEMDDAVRDEAVQKLNGVDRKVLGV